MIERQGDTNNESEQLFGEKQIVEPGENWGQIKETTEEEKGCKITCSNKNASDVLSFWKKVTVPIFGLQRLFFEKFKTHSCLERKSVPIIRSAQRSETT